MIETIKNFIEFRKYISLYKEIDLTNSEKRLLLTLDEKKTLSELLNKIKNNISNKVISDNLSPDFVLGAKYTLSFLKTITKR